MTDENTPAETVEAEAPEQSEAENKVPDAIDTEEKSKEEATNTDNKIDYEAILAKEREAREKAEKALAAKRFKVAERKRQEEVEDVEEVDKPLTRADLQAILAAEREETEKRLFAVRAEEIAQGLAGSDGEKNAILEIHRNRTFPSHLSLEEQLEEAYIIANKSKLIGERNEALRALKNRAGVNNNAASTHRDAPQGNAPKLSPQDEQALKEVGFAWNGTTRRYEKKLPNGDVLVRDSKTKQTFVSKKSR